MKRLAILCGGASISTIVAVFPLPSWLDIGLLGTSIPAQIYAACSGLEKPQTAIVPEEVTVSAPPSDLDFFDFNLLNDFNRIPHVLLLGQTGSGKSVMCERLLSHTPGRIVICDPHSAPDSWQKIRGAEVVGRGRKFCDIAQRIVETGDLMQMRYEQLALGVKTWEPVTIVLDEFPALVGEVKETDKDLHENLMSTFKRLLREARKVSIRMIILTQSYEVKSLGVSGEGSVRDCLRWIRLGDFCRRHVASLGDDRLSEYIQAQRYPATFEDQPIQ